MKTMHDAFETVEKDLQDLVLATVRERMAKYPPEAIEAAQKFASKELADFPLDRLVKPTPDGDPGGVTMTATDLLQSFGTLRAELVFCKVELAQLRALLASVLSPPAPRAGTC